MNLDGWLGVESPLAAAVEKTSRDQLAAYQKHPPLILEHANQESEIVSGGYGRKQLYELVQNAADELIGRGGRVEVVLTKDALYCANEGDAFTVQGATTLLGSHVSTKRGVEIGRFGLGFKSVLGVTSRPEIFSRSGSFGFDATRARDAILRAVPGQTATPTLRVGFALDPRDEAATDETLKGLMSWATTVIRLPRDERADWLHEDFETFPAEFLIFSTHVTELVLDDNPSHNRRDLKIDGEGSKMTLSVNGAASEWHVFSEEYRPSSAAKTDGGYSAERDLQRPVETQQRPHRRHRRSVQRGTTRRGRQTLPRRATSHLSAGGSRRDPRDAPRPRTRTPRICRRETEPPHRRTRTRLSVHSRSIG
jgi:hypothetical protein